MPSSRPEPVLAAGKIAGAVSGAVTGVGGLLVLVGYMTSEDVESLAVVAGGAVTGVGALIAAVLPVITALGARAQVTPLSNPISVDGNLLVPVTQPAAPSAPSASATEDELPDWVTRIRRRPAVPPVAEQAVDRSPLPIELEARAAAGQSARA